MERSGVFAKKNNAVTAQRLDTQQVDERGRHGSRLRVAIQRQRGGRKKTRQFSAQNFSVILITNLHIGKLMSAQRTVHSLTARVPTADCSSFPPKPLANVLTPSLFSLNSRVACRHQGGPNDSDFLEFILSYYHVFPATNGRDSKGTVITKPGVRVGPRYVKSTYDDDGKMFSFMFPVS